MLSINLKPTLNVKGGRLVNNAPCSNIGINEAAKMRKERKREEKISMIAQGYERGEMMSEMRKETGLF